MNFVRVDGYKYVFHPNGTILRIWDGYTNEVKTSKDGKGYMKICLYKDGKRKTFKVHRLLAIAFIPNPQNKPFIDHINGIKHDNRLENLRWVTHQENMNGFRSNPVQVITKGGISKTKYGWKWKFYMTGKRKSKQMKSKEDLLKFREKKLAEHQF